MTPLEAVLDKYEVRYRSDRVGEQSVLCEFHEERRPSCSINLGTGLFHCHSCGAGGDAYTFIMLKEGVEFREASRILAEITGEPAVGSVRRSRGTVAPGTGYRFRVNRRGGVAPGARRRSNP